MSDFAKYEILARSNVMWKQVRQEVRQHWFIYSYIAAYIQVLYMYCPVLLEYTQLV